MSEIFQDPAEQKQEAILKLHELATKSYQQGYAKALEDVLPRIQGAISVLSTTENLIKQLLTPAEEEQSSEQQLGLFPTAVDE